MTTLLQAIEVVPAAREHAPWITSTFAKSASDAESDPEHVRLALRRVIHRVLVDPRTRACVAVPMGYHDDFIGWACALDNVLTFVYVKYTYRRQGLGTALAAQVIDPDGPIRVAYWTRAAGRMALGGYPIVHDMGAQSELAQYAR